MPQLLQNFLRMGNLTTSGQTAFCLTKRFCAPVNTHPKCQLMKTRDQRSCYSTCEQNKITKIGTLKTL
jgi:hypothetical protein